MNLLHLKYFTEVANCSNMSQAARQLNISEPSLSLTISKLEKELDVPLFNRVGRNIVLSEQGKIFYDYISKALYLINDGVKITQRYYNKEQHTLTIHSTAMSTLTNFAFSYLKNHTDSYLNVRPISPSEIDESLNNADVDFVVSSIPFSSKDASTIQLAKEQMYLILNINHPLAKKEYVTIDELKNEKIIFPPSKKSGILDNVTELFSNADYVPNIVSKCDLELRIAMASINNGVTMGAESAILSESLPDNVIFIPIVSKNSVRTINLLWNKSKYIFPNEEKFIKEIKSYYSDYVNRAENKVKEIRKKILVEYNDF